VRSGGLWHPRLAAVIAGMGHTETLVVADPGLPVPRGVETVDLVWARNEPRLLPVLEVVRAELVVEEAVIAEELTDEALREGVRGVMEGIAVKTTSHEDLKTRCQAAKVIIRTGEATPYANVLLRAGVPF
jgi:D-ribose pyranase